MDTGEYNDEEGSAHIERGEQHHISTEVMDDDNSDDDSVIVAFQDQHQGIATITNKQSNLTLSYDCRDTTILIDTSSTWSVFKNQKC